MAQMSSSLSGGAQRSELTGEAKENITERLSRLENLYFPRALQGSTNSPSERKSILLDLLSRDAVVFLERYGSQLTNDELHEFNRLKDDYEVNWHLNHLRSIMSPTLDDLRSKSISVKNRRRAYLNKLIYDGEYFSEDAMREREPYLHHEYVGKFQDPSGRSMARPGERWSDTLMRRTEESILVAEIRKEQQRLGVAERGWVGNPRREEQDMDVEEEEEEEEEEEDENDKDQDSNNVDHTTKDSESLHRESTSGGNEGVSLLSAAEMQDQMDQFVYIMQQKFLTGEDNQHLDYSKIDEDETLDDHWLQEADRDAEEKYFADD